MAWIKRLILAIPFVIAAGLMLLGNLAHRLHLRVEPIAGYAFLFAAPWAWLVDHDWFGPIQNQWLDQLVFYSILLWIPALLYSLCLWALLHGIALIRKRVKR